MVTPVNINNYLNKFSNNNMQTPNNNFKTVNIRTSNPIPIPLSRCMATQSIAITPPNSITIDQNNNYMFNHQQYQQHLMSTPMTANHQPHFFITSSQQQFPQQQIQKDHFSKNHFQQQIIALCDNTPPSSCSLAVSS